MPLSYSENGRFNRSIFFEAWNDIDVFIEDTCILMKKVFIELLRNHLPPNYNVTEIHQLGGRTNVIERCRQSTSPSRSEIYIIDGDLYLISSEPLVEPKLVTIPGYCVENLLLESDCIYKIIEEDNVSCEYAKIKEKLNIENWLNCASNDLIDLFVLYAVAKEHGYPNELIAFKVGKIQNKGIINKTKLSLRSTEILSWIRENGLIDTSQRKILEYKEKINASGNVIKYISGKDYLFPLLNAYICEYGRFRISNSETFKFRLSKLVSSEEFRQRLAQEIA